MIESVPCELCGEPMPKGEEMFNYHGYSGPCPKPPLPKAPKPEFDAQRIAEIRERMKHLDTKLGVGDDWIEMLDTLLTQDLPYLLNAIEALKRAQQ